MTTIEIIENYGSVRANKSYRLLAEGPDWICLRVRGKLIYVSKIFIEG